MENTLHGPTTPLHPPMLLGMHTTRYEKADSGSALPPAHPADPQHDRRRRFVVQSGGMSPAGISVLGTAVQQERDATEDGAGRRLLRRAQGEFHAAADADARGREPRGVDRAVPGVSGRVGRHVRDADENRRCSGECGGRSICGRRQGVYASPGALEAAAASRRAGVAVPSVLGPEFLLLGVYPLDDPSGVADQADCEPHGHR